MTSLRTANRKALIAGLYIEFEDDLRLVGCPKTQTLLGCQEEIRGHYETAVWPLRLLEVVRRAWRERR